MAHIVTDLCLDQKHTTCVEVCPVDCIHEGERMLYIDPHECIDCGACIPACPVQAIFYVDELPERYQAWVQINAEQAPKYPVIKVRKTPLASG